MEVPHLPCKLGMGRGIRPSQISVICGVDHELSEHYIIKPVQPGPAGFCQALVVLGWASSAGTHPSRDFSRASDKPTAPLGPVLVRRRWLLTITGRELALPRCLARQKRPCPLHFLGITMVPAGQKDSIYPVKILSCTLTEPLHLPGLHFSSYQAERWESLQL